MPELAIWRGQLHQDVYLNGVNVHPGPLVVTGTIRFANGWVRPFRFDVAPGGQWELFLPDLLTSQELATVAARPQGALKAFGEVRCDKACRAKVVTWYEPIRRGVAPTIQNVEWTCPE